MYVIHFGLNCFLGKIKFDVIHFSMFEFISMSVATAKTTKITMWSKKSDEGIVMRQRSRIVDF